MTRRAPRAARPAPRATSPTARATSLAAGATSLAAGATTTSAPLPRVLQALLAAARAVRRHAHAPYSRFSVGAAVLDESGRIHAGCNLENASYGLTVCAERNAVAAAVAAGARKIEAVAIATLLRNPPASPCGACRQVLAELAGDDALVLMAGPTGPPQEERLGALLPRAFRLR